MPSWWMPQRRVAYALGYVRRPDANDSARLVAEAESVRYTSAAETALDANAYGQTYVRRITASLDTGEEVEEPTFDEEA